MTRHDRQVAGYDLYGNVVEVGCVVAYNWSGNVAMGQVIRVTQRGVIWIDRRPIHGSLGRDTHGVSKVKGGPACCLVLKAAR